MELNEIIQDGEISILNIASCLAYEPLVIQREFLQIYFEALSDQANGGKHTESLFKVILSENGEDFKNALRCGL